MNTNLKGDVWTLVNSRRVPRAAVNLLVGLRRARFNTRESTRGCVPRRVHVCAHGLIRDYRYRARDFRYTER